jgi:uncharacterized protein (DUF427 family)
MSLTLGTGPLGHAPAGAFNFDLAAAAPKHRIYFADFLPRVRAVVAGRTVLDTTRGKLLYESGIPARFYAPLDDFDPGALARTDHSTHCPFKGDASYWAVTANGSTRDNAVWAYETPIADAAWLDGYASLYHDRADEWWVEDERVTYLRDPFHRVDVLPSSRRVRVTSGDRVLVDTDRAMLLFETGVPPRAYVLRADVRAPVEPSAHDQTHCPYKGDARYWTVAGVEGAAWSIEYPRPEATGVAGRLAFDPERVEVEIG